MLNVGRPETLLRPALHEEAGHFALLLHHSPPKSYPEEVHTTVQVCVPFHGARYDVLRSSESGSRLTHRLRTGDILVVPEGQPHAVNWLRSADILSLHLSSDFLEKVLEAPAPSFRDALILHDPLIGQMAAELRNAVKGGTTSSALFESCAALIAYRIAKQAAGAINFAAEPVRPLAPHERSRVAEYIDTHLHRPIRVADMASILGLSQWHFLRRFHITEGTTPNQFIIQRRLERASELLVRTNRSVTQIAIEVGMSPSHFSRAFLQTLGIRPSSFRAWRGSSTAR